MRILRVHNRYQQRGGEDAVFEAEVALLQAYGDTVQIIDLSNDSIATSRSPRATAKLALDTIWSTSGRRLVADAVAASEPHVVHFDNTFPLISPAAYSVARDHGAAVVQTLHNYRLVCPAATLYRDRAVCEDCLGRSPLPGVVHGCYRHSRSQSAVVASMLTAHRLSRTWLRDVDRYIALSGFARSKFIEGGLPASLIAVKPNFVTIEPESEKTERSDFLFVGRLAPEKGVRTLLAAVRRMNGIHVRVAGDGPLAAEVASACALNPALTVLGRLDPAQVRREMRSCRALVFPSEWYEGFPLTILEAFACGTPVIASRLGAMADIVDHGRTGLLFEPGNAEDLAEKMRWAHAHPNDMRVMGENARREYELTYTPDRNYTLLMGIYDEAIAHARRRDRRGPVPGQA